MLQSAKPNDPSPPRVRALVFDLDGTLIDSAPDIAKAINHILMQDGRPPLSLDTVKTLIGDGAGVLVERAYGLSGPKPDADTLMRLTERFVEHYAALPADPDTVFPGVRDMLAELSADGIRLGLATNKPGLATRKLLSELDLDRHFTAVAAGDSLPYRKPDGRHLAWVIGQLGATAATTVMVGDNANDVAVARAVGCPVVAVSFGYPRMPIADLGADIVIDRFSDLRGALDLLRRR